MRSQWCGSLYLHAGGQTHPKQLRHFLLSQLCLLKMALHEMPQHDIAASYLDDKPATYEECARTPVQFDAMDNPDELVANCSSHRHTRRQTTEFVVVSDKQSKGRYLLTYSILTGSLLFF
jgi:hypothetical protein